MPKSKCTIGLVAKAAQAAYFVKENNQIDCNYSNYGEVLDAIESQGYKTTEKIAPKSSKGTGNTPLAAICFEPEDQEQPIIISFRGTKTSDDLLSDLRLGMIGVVEQEFRDAAFKFYEEVRKRNPNREIILTGHSLGGHLAQYVAAKAYNTDSDPNLIKKRLLHVRTFNSAPVDSNHGVILDKNPQLLSNFVNYRLTNDLISDLPLVPYYGSTFVLPCEKGFWDSHPMGAVSEVLQSLPSEISSQTIGSNTPIEKSKEELIELMRGAVSSYECRVKGQFLYPYRAGADNLKKLEAVLPVLIEDIEKGSYDHALTKLRGVRKVLDGLVSEKIVSVLEKEIRKVKQEVKLEKQQGFKARFQNLKPNENSASEIANLSQQRPK